jgi:hypothetical protein
MTIVRDMDWDRDLVTITVLEPWSVGEFVSDVRRWAGEPDHRMPTRAIVDFRQVTTVPTPEEISSLIGYLDRHRQILSRMRAIVVSSEVLYGMGRMASIYAELKDMEMAVFTDLGEAERWLGLAP